MPEHTIKALCERSHAIAQEKGWGGNPCHTDMILMQSELSEALEDWRQHHPVKEVWYEVTDLEDPNGVMQQIDAHTWEQGYSSMERSQCSAKPCGIPSELADFVIRICHRAGVDRQGDELERLLAVFTTERDGLRLKDLESLLAQLTLSVALSYRDGVDGRLSYVHLADALSLLFAFCQAEDVDLWAAIDEKEAYNRSRSFRHGGKKV